MKKLFTLMIAFVTLVSLSACSYTPALTGLSVDKETVELMVSETVNITCQVTTEADQEGFNTPIFQKVGQPNIDISFSSADSSIVIVDDAGHIGGLAPGQTTVTATATDGKNTFTKEIKVTCFRYMDSLVDIPEVLAAEVGESNDLSAICGDFTVWDALAVSSDDSIAICDGAKILAVSPGDVTISLSLGTETKDISFRSVQMVTAYELNHETLEGEVGSNSILEVGFREPVTANGGLALTYESSDKEIATVDPNGTVHFVAPGEATITTANELGIKAECKVTVTEKKSSRNSSGYGGLFLTHKPGGINYYDTNGNLVDTYTPSAPATIGITNPGDYDRSIPAVSAVLDMVGQPYKCSQVAEAAANAQGTTGWVSEGNFNILAPEGFLSIGTKIPYDQAQPGDILYYANGGLGYSHVAVYIGNGMAVHGNFDANMTTKIASATYTTLTSVIHIG